MSFLQLVLSLDKTIGGFNSIFADSVILTHIATSPFLKRECLYTKSVCTRNIILVVQALGVEFLWCFFWMLVVV